jgi:hypothetical protein
MVSFLISLNGVALWIGEANLELFEARGGPERNIVSASDAS